MYKYKINIHAGETGECCNTGSVVTVSLKSQKRAAVMEKWHVCDMVDYDPKKQIFRKVKIFIKIIFSITIIVL